MLLTMDKNSYNDINHHKDMKCAINDLVDDFTRNSRTKTYQNISKTSVKF